MEPGDHKENWELSKENIQPLPTGRRIAYLTHSLAHSSRQEDQEEEIANQIRLFQVEIKTYSGGDKLDPWVRYIAFLEQTTVGGFKTKYYSLMGECVRTFFDDPQYHNDRRFVEIFIKQLDVPVFERLQLLRSALLKSKIGSKVSRMYLAIAECYEQVSNYPKAVEILKIGIQQNASPVEYLEDGLSQLQYRVAEKLAKEVNINDENNARNFGDSVPVYGPENDAPSVRGHLPPAVPTDAKPILKKECGLTLYQDVDDSVETLDTGSSSTHAIERLKSLKNDKENKLEPSKWNKPNNPISVCEDYCPPRRLQNPIQLYAEGEQVGPNPAPQVGVLSDRTEKLLKQSVENKDAAPNVKIMYRKHQLRTEDGSEITFEHLRAMQYRQKLCLELKSSVVNDKTLLLQLQEAQNKIRALEEGVKVNARQIQEKDAELMKMQNSSYHCLRDAQIKISALEEAAKVNARQIQEKDAELMQMHHSSNHCLREAQIKITSLEEATKVNARQIQEQDAELMQMQHSSNHCLREAQIKISALEEAAKVNARQIQEKDAELMKMQHSSNHCLREAQIKISALEEAAKVHARQIQEKDTELIKMQGNFYNCLQEAQTKISALEEAAKVNARRIEEKDAELMKMQGSSYHSLPEAQIKNRTLEEVAKVNARQIQEKVGEFLKTQGNSYLREAQNMISSPDVAEKVNARQIQEKVGEFLKTQGNSNLREAQNMISAPDVAEKVDARQIQEKEDELKRIQGSSIHSLRDNIPSFSSGAFARPTTFKSASKLFLPPPASFTLYESQIETPNRNSGSQDKDTVQTQGTPSQQNCVDHLNMPENVPPKGEYSFTLGEDKENHLPESRRTLGEIKKPIGTFTDMESRDDGDENIIVGHIAHEKTIDFNITNNLTRALKFHPHPLLNSTPDGNTKTNTRFQTPNSIPIFIDIDENNDTDAIYTSPVTNDRDVGEGLLSKQTGEYSRPYNNFPEAPNVQNLSTIQETSKENRSHYTTSSSSGSVNMTRGFASSGFSSLNNFTRSGSLPTSASSSTPYTSQSNPFTYLNKNNI